MGEQVGKMAGDHDIATSPFKSSNGTHSTKHVGRAIEKPNMVDPSLFRNLRRICTETEHDSSNRARNIVCISGLEAGSATCDAAKRAEWSFDGVTKSGRVQGDVLRSCFGVLACTPDTAVRSCSSSSFRSVASLAYALWWGPALR